MWCCERRPTSMKQFAAVLELRARYAAIPIGRNNLILGCRRWKICVRRHPPQAASRRCLIRRRLVSQEVEASLALQYQAQFRAPNASAPPWMTAPATRGKVGTRSAAPDRPCGRCEQGTAAGKRTRNACLRHCLRCQHAHPHAANHRRHALAHGSHHASSQTHLVDSHGRRRQSDKISSAPKSAASAPQRKRWINSCPHPSHLP